MALLAVSLEKGCACGIESSPKVSILIVELDCPLNGKGSCVGIRFATLLHGRRSNSTGPQRSARDSDGSTPKGLAPEGLDVASHRKIKDRA